MCARGLFANNLIFFSGVQTPEKQEQPPPPFEFDIHITTISGVVTVLRVNDATTVEAVMQQLTDRQGEDRHRHARSELWRKDADGRV
jgi:hypothetical protein